MRLTELIETLEHKDIFVDTSFKMVILYAESTFKNLYSQLIYYPCISDWFLQKKIDDLYKEVSIDMATFMEKYNEDDGEEVEGMISLINKIDFLKMKNDGRITEIEDNLDKKSVMLMSIMYKIESELAHAKLMYMIDVFINEQVKSKDEYIQMFKQGIECYRDTLPDIYVDELTNKLIHYMEHY